MQLCQNTAEPGRIIPDAGPCQRFRLDHLLQRGPGNILLDHRERSVFFIEIEDLRDPVDRMRLKVPEDIRRIDLQNLFDRDLSGFLMLHQVYAMRFIDHRNILII